MDIQIVIIGDNATVLQSLTVYDACFASRGGGGGSRKNVNVEVTEDQLFSCTKSYEVQYIG